MNVEITVQQTSPDSPTATVIARRGDDEWTLTVYEGVQPCGGTLSPNVERGWYLSLPEVAQEGYEGYGNTKHASKREALKAAVSRLLDIVHSHV